MENYIHNKISSDALFTLFSESPVGLALLNCEDFIIEAANEKMLELWASTVNIVSKPLFDAVPQLKNQEFHSILLEVCDSGKIFTEKKNPTKIACNDGIINRYFDFIFSPVFDSSEKVVQVVIVSKEVTEEVSGISEALASKFKLKELILDSEYISAILTGRDMVIEIGNEKFFETVGKTSAIIGMKFLDAVPSLKGQHFIDEMQNVYDTGIPYEIKEDKATIERDGVLETLYYTFTYQPLKNSMGKVIAIYNIGMDVTDTVLAKKSALESYNQLQSFIQNVPMAIAIYKGADFKLELANKGANDLWGDLSPFYGHRIKDIFPEFESSGLFQDFEQVFNSGKELKMKGLMLHRTGNFEEKYFDYILYPSKDEAGKTISVIAIAYEVTEDLKIRKKLSQSEEKYRNLSDALPLIIFTANPEAEIVYCNDKLKNYLGESVADPIGEKFYHLSHPDDVEELKEIWQEALRNKENFEAEHRSYNTFSKQYNWLLTRAVPIFGEDGEIVEWIGSSTNVNEFKLLEAQKDTFLGIASHELKTPLTSLKIYAQVLERVLKKAGDDKNAEYAHKMDAQVTKLNSLIGDLLDVTNMTLGKMQLNEENFNFEDLAEEMVEELQLNAPQKITFEKKSGGMVIADKNRISQVMSNLISNAIKYSPETKEIIVTTQLIENGVEFCVQDFGMGMPEDQKDKVFAQYYRVSGETQTTIPGLGLGLYISAEIIERSNGKIWVNSILGKGSTFCFSLPVIEN